MAGKHFFTLATMKQLCATILVSLFLLTACSQHNNEAKTSGPRTVLRFDVDTAGNISDSFPEVKKQLKEIAIQMNNNADRVVIYSYTEKMDSKEESMVIAKRQADAAKQVMMQFGERVYYNAGIELKGFAEPIDAAHPSAASNRRIEIETVQ